VVAVSAELHFQLLGPVQASHAGQPLALGGAKPKAVLAALLCHPNTPVDTDRLIRWVWGEGKEGARDSLYHYIADLRTALAPAAEQVRLEGLRPGYRLTVAEPEQVIDWHHFAALLDQARAARQAGEPSAAIALLDQALRLWQGPALDGLGDALAELRATMTTRRLSAAEDLAELELDHGDPTHVPDLLEELCQQHPGRERAAALLTRALGALGRRDDAVAVYRRTRDHTRNSLGLDPHGPLERAYQTILRDPTAATTAAQQALRAGLPRLAGHFIGRHTELDQLTTLLTGESDQPQVVVICAVEGMAGIGKTELAKHAAYQHADHFPDGILFLDLLGYTPEADPLHPAAALDRLLRRLGVPGPQIPADPEDRATLYRAKLADKRMLILLDNARTSSQVQPLLPATPGCRVLITSRRRLTALDDATPIHLDILHPADAHALFVRLTGLDPTPEESTAITRIVTACGRLPLAIRITAARYRNHAWTTLAELEGHLADQHERLATVDDGERSITAAFTVSYHSLPADQRRMFRLLGLIPGPEPDTEAYAAAALADIRLSDAERLLTHLADASLLTRPVPGRYGFHDLLRAYATQRGLEEEPEADQRAALTRLFDHYTHATSAAAEVAYPQDRGYLPRPPAPPTPRPDFPDQAEAAAWLDAERRNLLAAADHAATHGWPVHTSHLSHTLDRHLRIRAHYTDALTLHTHALHATRGSGDRAGQGRALASLGDVYLRVGRYEQAIDHHQQALSITREVGDRAGEGRALGGLGEVYGIVGRYEGAIDHDRQALAVAREVGDPVGERHALIGLGEVYGMAGRYEEAIDHYQQALAVAREVGDRVGESYTLINLGNVYRLVGRYEQAIDHHQQALATFREVGDRAGESYTLTFLGAVYWLVGRYEQAIGYHQQGLAIAFEIGDRNGQFEAHNGLGEALRATNQPKQALTHHHHAATLAAELGQPHDHARALDGIAHAHRDLGHPDQARHHWQQALQIFTQLGTPEADQVREHLAALDPPGNGPVQVTPRTPPAVS
jgi:tetratricopeptide (TPR) repeat protein